MEEGSASGTAEMVCFFRALDQQWDGDTSLINDKYAHLFLSPKMQERLANYADRSRRDRYRKLLMYLFDWIILRHAAIDDLVRQHGREMFVVILGAGYDSRALRLKDSMRHGVAEVDFPATGEAKQKLLKAGKLDTSHIRFEKADLIRKPLADILSDLGLKGKKALVIWEGVTMYVPQLVVERTIHTIATELAPGSILVADYYNEAGRTGVSVEIVKAKTEQFSKTFKSEPILFMSDPTKLEALGIAQGAKRVTTRTASGIAAAAKRDDFTDTGMFALAEFEF